jgi:hypothetical protein
MSDNAKTMQLTVTSLPADGDDASVIVERISNLLLEGYTSGYEPYWTFDVEPEQPAEPSPLDVLARRESDLSLFEHAAYELLRERTEQDEDFPFTAPYDPQEALRVHEWLVAQAKSLGGVFSSHAEHFEPDPFPWRQA